MADYRPTPAGQRRHKLTIQGKVDGLQERDSAGGVEERWTTEVTRWAKVEPLRGRELLEAHQVDARLTHKITMRYYAGLTPSHRLLFGTRVFHVLAPLDPEERHIEVEVLVMEDI